MEESWNQEVTARRIDLLGAFLSALGLGGISFAVIQVCFQLEPAPRVALGATGVVAVVGFLLHEMRTEAPILPLKLFRSRNFSAANGLP